MTESLTLLDERSGETLSGRADAQPLDTLARGVAIGRYVILGIAGHGGMGVVYRAYDPELQREIAIKLLRAGKPGREDVAEARLRREAQAMARVSHPNVLPVYDVGTHDGRVWLALEYLEGQTLADWIEAEPRRWDEVVAMFLQAARGLAAAHAVGLVHRDFKPQNVIVGADGRARVMDFGLALLAAGDTSIGPSTGELRIDGDSVLPDGYATQLTVVGAVVGTPRYMAPEQHVARDIDPRADQFAFCVALYEALFRVRAFEGTSLNELARRKQRGEWSEPHQPGGVPSTIRRALARGMAGALEQRFTDMSELVGVLEAALVQARPGRRRRWGWYGAGIAVLGAGALVWGTRTRPCHDGARKLAGAWDEGVRARIEAAMLTTDQPWVRESVDDVRARVDAWASEWARAHDEACAATELHGEQSQHLLDLRIACLDRQRAALTATLEVLGRGEAEVTERAVTMTATLPDPGECAGTDELLLRTPMPGDPEAVAAIERMQRDVSQANALIRGGKAEEAVALLEPDVDEARTLGHPPLLAEVLEAYADALGDLGHDDRERALCFEGLAAALAGHANRVAMELAADISWIEASSRGDADEALRWIAIGRGLLDTLADPGRAEIVLVNAEIFARIQASQFDQAQELAEILLARLRASPGEEPILAQFTANVGALLGSRGRYGPARRYTEESIELYRRLLGDDHPQSLAAQANLGIFDVQEARYAVAIERLEHVLAQQERVLGPDHPTIANTLTSLGTALRASGRVDEAIAIQRRSLALSEQAYGPRSRAVTQALDNVAIALRSAGRVAEARELVDRAFALRSERFPDDHPERATAHMNRGDQSMAEGKLLDALADFDRAIALRRAVLGAEHPLTLHVGLLRAEARVALGQVAAARDELEEMLRIETTRGVEATITARTRSMLARLVYDVEPVRARSLAQLALIDLAGDEPIRRKIETWLAEHPAPPSAEQESSP